MDTQRDTAGTQSAESVDHTALLEQASERQAMIASERDSYRSKLAALELKQALTDAANAVDGDLDILLPYLRGTGALDTLDSSTDDFDAQVAEIVTAAVETNPKLRKATPVVAPTRSGGDVLNSPGASRRGPQTVEDFIHEAREQREPESVDDIRKHIRIERGC